MSKGNHLYANGHRAVRICKGIRHAEVWPLNLSSDEARDWMVITFGYFFLTVTGMKDIVIWVCGRELQ